MCDDIPMRFAWSASILAATLVPLACAPAAAPAIAAHSLILPLQGPCPVDGSSAGGEFSSEVQQFSLAVTGPGIDAPIEVSGGTNELKINVPQGDNRTVALFGLVNGQPAWRGITRGVKVTAGEDSPVDVLLARVADLSCARTTTGDKRMFHSATRLNDGTVLVVGGANDDVDASATCGAGCRKLTATTSAAIYDPRTGVFQAVGQLGTARMFHTATVLGDGRVLVAGGTEEAFLRPVDPAAHPFPIEPTRPTADLEIYDPSARTFTSLGADPNGPRVFAAAVALSTGSVLLTGGVPGAGSPRNDLGNALNTSTQCGGSPVICQRGPPLARRRAGHLAFAVEPEGILLWGGSVQPDDHQSIPGTACSAQDSCDTGQICLASGTCAFAGFQVELLQTGGAAFQLHAVDRMNEARNLFFAASAQYVDYRMLAAGGLTRASDGSFAMASIDIDGLERGPGYVLDMTASRSGGIATQDPATAPLLHIEHPRAFGAAAGLPDEARAIVAGGFLDLAFTPAADLDLFRQSPQLQTTPIQVGGQPRTLRQPRGGVTATAIGDGTVLLVGGTDENGPSETAEIFADPINPPDIAGVSP